MNQLTIQLEAFSFRLRQLQDELRSIMQAYNGLSQQAQSTLSDSSVSYGLGDTLRLQKPGHEYRALEIRSISLLLINILEAKGVVMTISEITAAMLATHQELIPVQIINVKAWIARKLEKACADRLLIAEPGMQGQGKVYGLPSWLGKDGWLRDSRLKRRPEKVAG